MKQNAVKTCFPMEMAHGKHGFVGRWRTLDAVSALHPGCLMGPSSITVLPGLRFTAGHFLLPAQCYGPGKWAGLSDTKTPHSPSPTCHRAAARPGCSGERLQPIQSTRWRERWQNLPVTAQGALGWLSRMEPELCARRGAGPAGAHPAPPPVAVGTKQPRSDVAVTWQSSGGNTSANPTLACFFPCMKDQPHRSVPRACDFMFSLLAFFSGFHQR